MPTRAAVTSRIKELERSHAKAAAWAKAREESPICICPQAVGRFQWIDRSVEGADWPDVAECDTCLKPVMAIIYHLPPSRRRVGALPG